jgi:hypothetical protein
LGVVVAGSARRMTDQTSHPQLDALLDEAFRGQERLSRDEIYRRAVAAGLPAESLTRVDALPEGDYAQNEAAEALRQEQALPLGHSPDTSADRFLRPARGYSSIEEGPLSCSATTNGAA